MVEISYARCLKFIVADVHAVVYVVWREREREREKEIVCVHVSVSFFASEAHGNPTKYYLL